MCIFLPEKQTGSKPKANQKQTGNKKEKEIEIEIELEIELELELEGEGDNGCYPLIPPYGGASAIKMHQRTQHRDKCFVYADKSFFL